ncbi:MAG: carboxypeptidase regulatory-like domain-containing protein [Rhodothermaceae bacterium]|nr:carboxypeptidase regulatory-like domain-containing protein [Rhodothermaceae bacterium]
MPVRFGYILLSLLLAGCLGEAERGNPLDPLSDNFQNVGAVFGTVTTFYAPFDGLPGAQVQLMPLNEGLDGEAELRAPVDGSGSFSLTDVPAGTYAVAAEADGFATAMDTVTIALGQRTEVDLRLNGIPVVTVRAFHTEHIDRWFPQDPLFQLVVEVTVGDPDGVGDIEGVHLTLPSLGFADTLRAVAGEPGAYRRVFSESELPVAAQDLLGEPFRIAATDRPGAQGLTSAVQIVRIITNFPNGLEPAPGPGGRPVVAPQPTFTWRAVTVPFGFTYRLDLTFVPVPGQETPFQSYLGLPSTATTFTLPEALPPGDYDWTVSAVDAFGNLSRSRPLGFRVGGTS